LPPPEAVRPEQIAEVAASHTGRYLKPLLTKRRTAAE
jgi:hypothetical protein